MGKSTRIGSSGCSVTSAMPARHVLAPLHLADAEPAGERRLDRLLGDHRLDPLDGRQRRVALGARRIQVGLRRHALLASGPPGAGTRPRPPAASPWRWRGRPAPPRCRAAPAWCPAPRLRRSRAYDLGDDAGDLARSCRRRARRSACRSRRAARPISPCALPRTSPSPAAAPLRQDRLDHLRLEHELELGEPAERGGNHDSGDDEASAHGATTVCRWLWLQQGGGTAKAGRAIAPSGLSR